MYVHNVYLEGALLNVASDISLNALRRFQASCQVMVDLRHFETKIEYIETLNGE